MIDDAKTDIWMPLWIGDYLADTSHLSATEHGAYLLLLMHYWRKGPLPNDLAKIAQIAKLPLDARSIAQALLNEFFSLHDDGLYHQKRCDREIAKWQGKREKAKEKASAAAQARWKDRAPGNALGSASSNAPSIPPSNAQAMLGSCPSPSPSNEKPTPKAAPSSLVVPDWVPRRSWDAWLEIRKKKGAKNTDRALDLAVRKLDRLRATGEDPAEVLDESTLRSWTGLFPVKSGHVSVPIAKSIPHDTEPILHAHPSRVMDFRPKAGVQ